MADTSSTRRRRGGKHFVVLDNQPGPEYDNVLGTWLQMNYRGSPPEQPQAMRLPHILPDGAIQYPALTAGDPAELYIVTQRPAAESTAPPEAKPAPVKSYSTRFQADEDPISEGQKWINGGKDGID